MMHVTSVPSMSKRMSDFVAIIRMYTRDHPELNRLIRGEETSDRMIAWAVVDAIDDFNATPPFLNTRYGVTNFPSLSLLREGTVFRLLESTALLQARNHISYSDGGISASVSDKGPLLMNWAQLFRQNYERQRDRIKASINIEEAFGGGGTVSEYFVVNGLYLSI